MTYVFLDPDGTLLREMGLHTIMEAPTGVVYAHQCAGHANERREREGYLLPVGTAKLAAPLRELFRREFRGWPPGTSSATWTDERLDALGAIVATIPFWQTGREEDRRSSLALDRSRLDDLTEGWIPVQTPEGRGILVFEKSD